MNLATLLQWQGIITVVASLGVKSFTTIKAMLVDAGVDDATIEALAPKWDALVDDIRRAAGE